MALGLGATACSNVQDQKLPSLSLNLPTPSPPLSLSLSPPPPSPPLPRSTAAPYRDKYAQPFPACQSLAEKLPNMPPLVRAGDKSPATDQYVYCEFIAVPRGPNITVQLYSWRSDPEDLRYPADLGRGRAMAREGFAADLSTTNDGPAPDLGVGEQAKWETAQIGDSCFVRILDANALIHLRYWTMNDDRLDPKSEQCRGPLRALGKSVYDVIQPR